MIGREKVIKGLECCLVQTEEFPPLCEECPYRDEKIGSCEYYRDILSDALALLKVQEPRVLTLEEVKTIGAQNYNQVRDENIRLIWSEERNDLNIAKPTYNDFILEDNEEEPIYLYYVGTDFFDRFDQSTYGKNWRCWSSRPTDEQREAVPWQD